jgi:hypothetical protein
MTTRRDAAREAIRTPKAAAIAGIVFAVLLAIVMVLVTIAIPPDSREAGEWVLDDSDRRLVRVALHVLPFAGIAFLWFIGVVRDRIGEHEDRFFATVFLGSGLLFVAMTFASGALAAGLLARPESEAAGADEVWLYGRRVTYAMVTVYSMRMAAVFMISTTTLVTRFHLVPRWMAIVGFGGAAVLLLTTDTLRYVEVIFPAWVLVLSVHMLRASLRGGAGDIPPTSEATV